MGSFVVAAWAAIRVLAAASASLPIVGTPGRTMVHSGLRLARPLRAAVPAARAGFGGIMPRLSAPAFFLAGASGTIAIQHRADQTGSGGSDRNAPTRIRQHQALAAG